MSYDGSGLQQELQTARAQAVVQRPYAEPMTNDLNLAVLQSDLGSCLSIIDDEVMKGYVTRLAQLPIIGLQQDDLKNLDDVQFFRITELVYQEDEFSVDKLSMVFHTLSSCPCTLSLMLSSNGNQTDFYLGVRSNDPHRTTGTLLKMLKKTLMGFFPGSRIETFYDEDRKKMMQDLCVNSVASVTSVADYKRNEETITNKDFIQGLEKFVYAMQGTAYTAIFIADSVGYDQLMERRREYERICTQISPFANMQLNFSVSDGQSASTGSSKGSTHSISQTNTSGSTASQTDGWSKTQGVSQSNSTTDGTSDTQTLSETESEGQTHTVGTTDGTSHTVTNTVSVGVNGSVGKGVGTTVTNGTSQSATLGGNISQTVGSETGASVKVGPAGGNTSVSSFTTVGAFASATAGVMNSVANSLSTNVSVGASGGYSHAVSNSTSHTDSVSDSIAKTLSHGISNAHGTSHSLSKTRGTNESSGMSGSSTTGSSRSVAETTGESFNLVNTESMTNTFGNSRGITLNAQNATLDETLERLKTHLKRINECESVGMWNFAAYFLGETTADTQTAANTYKAVVAGENSGIENSAVNSWSKHDAVQQLMDYMNHFLHPLFLYQGEGYQQTRQIAVDPSALVSTNELALHMGLPRHSVRGLPVVEHAAFGQEVVSRKINADTGLLLGEVYHLGQKTGTEVRLDVNSLTMHTFITGSTGSGKSNAVYHLLAEAQKKGAAFLVVEPAKGEYKTVFPDVRCFGTNPQAGELLKINPFAFPQGIHVLEHIDRIVEIFNVCWPMYAAMPAVMKDSIERAYTSAGWDLDRSENLDVPGLFPTFTDVLRELNETIRSSDYSADTKGDYIGSLSTRLRSLTNGINGLVFVSDEMLMEDLFDKNAIIDLSRVGSLETKSLIMGFVVLKLQEYRMANATGMNRSLKHITVLEEAHNLLKRTSTEQSADASNLVGKSVEMLTNAIAEIRTYGEGFVIVDQAPNLLDTAAIRNTNTKIVLRLPEENDREITGGAMALKDNQYAELSKLPTGVAAVYQNDWQEAVLCALPKYRMFENIPARAKGKPTRSDRKKQCDEILHVLLKQKLNQQEKEVLAEKFCRINVSAKVRRDLIMDAEKQGVRYQWALADFIRESYAFHDVFRGSGVCTSLDELQQLLEQNLFATFEAFNREELHKISSCVCMLEGEKHPENETIRKLYKKQCEERMFG